MPSQTDFLNPEFDPLGDLDAKLNQLPEELRNQLIKQFHTLADSALRGDGSNTESFENIEEMDPMSFEYLDFLRNGGIELDDIITKDTLLKTVAGKITDLEERRKVNHIFLNLKRRGYEKIDDLLSLNSYLELPGIGAVANFKLIAIKAFLIETLILQAKDADPIAKLRAEYEEEIDWKTFGLDSKLWFEVQPQARVWSELSRGPRILTLSDLVNNINVVKETKGIGAKSIEAIDVLLVLCIEKGIITPDDYKTGLLRLNLPTDPNTEA